MGLVLHEIFVSSSTYALVLESSGAVSCNKGSIQRPLLAAAFFDRLFLLLLIRPRARSLRLYEARRPRLTRRHGALCVVVQFVRAFRFAVAFDAFLYPMSGCEKAHD